MQFQHALTESIQSSTCCGRWKARVEACRPRPPSSSTGRTTRASDSHAKLAGPTPGAAAAAPPRRGQNILFSTAPAAATNKLAASRQSYRFYRTFLSLSFTRPASLEHRLFILTPQADYVRADSSVIPHRLPAVSALPPPPLLALLLMT